MRTSPLKSAAFAAAGAALFGGGMFVGLVSAWMRRRPWEEFGAPPPPAGHPEPVAPPPAAAPDPVYQRRVDELMSAVADLRRRIDANAWNRPAPPAEPVTERLKEVSERVERLEERVEQLASETPAMPPVDHVLAAVEHMIAERIGGIDERLTDQVKAIETLRDASKLTDGLLQKLIGAVEALAEQTGERGGPGGGDEPPPAGQAAAPGL